MFKSDTRILHIFCGTRSYHLKLAVWVQKKLVVHKIKRVKLSVRNSCFTIKE